jgi:DNA-binding transcriptional ArsR family regulator
MDISDPQAIRALAHPLRLDLLELLVAIGPATAAQCGRVLGASQASCSFHLRQLAKYGFVAEAEPGPDRREHRWQLVRPAADRSSTWRVGPGTDAVVRRELERVVIEREAQAILDYAERSDGEFPGWEQKAGIVAAVAALTPDEAADLKEKWKALLEPYIVRTQAEARTTAGQASEPGRRLVRYFMAATPLPDITRLDSTPPDSIPEAGND